MYICTIEDFLKLPAGTAYSLAPKDRSQGYFLGEKIYIKQDTLDSGLGWCRQDLADVLANDSGELFDIQDSAYEKASHFDLDPEATSREMVYDRSDLWCPATGDRNLDKYEWVFVIYEKKDLQIIIGLLQQCLQVAPEVAPPHKPIPHPEPKKNEPIRLSDLPSRKKRKSWKNSLEEHFLGLLKSPTSA